MGESVKIIRSELVGCRADLAKLANRAGLKRAVEIGTDRGLFAREFLERWNGEMLYCVDTWLPYDEMPWDRNGDFALACQVLAPFANRCRIVRARSDQVAKYFGVVAGWPADIDFVYVDGAHSYNAVTHDIKLWFSVLRQGGYLAGDDFGPGHPEVMQAVKDFAEPFGDMTIYLTTDYDRDPSWFIEK